ncbi:MAG: nucleotidyltransferase domain-containing protein [Ktedonobacteraceae bacterium]|nr:nucleotidyltransferase domain-containing protein [Ktedonobacteraceae bacterium]
MHNRRERIGAVLRTIETDKQVRMLYACESGSRAWEFASHDSDYDVRFLYVRPREAYLKLDVPRDVIELPIVDDLDVNGWDIFKALRLLRKSNPPLLEWLFSPIVYAENSPLVARLREVARQGYEAPAIFYHYRHMAYGNYHQYIERKAEVPLKKYLYVLRPIIALRFIEEHNSWPPTSFLQTLGEVRLEQGVRERISELVARKQAGGEVGLGAPDAVLNAFIDEHLARWEKRTFARYDNREMTKQLDEILQQILAEGDV